MTAVPVTTETPEPLSASQDIEATLPPSGAFVGLNEARRLTGKSKETILKYAQNGKISTQLNGQGNKVYQVVDLGSVFGFKTTPTSQEKEPANRNDQSEKNDHDEATALKIAELEGKNAVLEAQLQAEREKGQLLKELAEKEARNADDLRNAMKMLTYRPEPAAPAQTTQPEPQPTPVPEPKRGFFARVFGGGNG